MRISTKGTDAFPSSLAEELHQLGIHGFIPGAFAVENRYRRDELDRVSAWASADVDEESRREGHTGKRCRQRQNQSTIGRERIQPLRARMSRAGVDQDARERSVELACVSMND